MSKHLQESKKTVLAVNEVMVEFVKSVNDKKKKTIKKFREIY